MRRHRRFANPRGVSELLRTREALD